MRVLVVIVVLLVIVGGFFVWYITTSNNIKRTDIKVAEALSGIDVALTKRYDVLTKMLDIVKNYQNYERETLMQIISLRSGMSMKERNEASRNMDKVSSDIRLLAENYPELRSSANFAELQKSVMDVEEHLQAARRLYNANVTSYNNMIVAFPSSVVANNIGAVKKDFFEAEAIKRQDVKMF
ncbi:LemA protein [Lachnospiraceae bacterium NE2001]|nr:LemA protein [Lachnospiraceae bacterium NE2001]